MIQSATHHTILTDRFFLGFEVSPSREIFQHQREELGHDIVGLLSSLTYQPPHISSITLDLRYVVERDASVAGKHLNIVLLLCLRLDAEDPPTDASQLRDRFREDFYNLLTLHLNPYEMRVSFLSEAEIQHYLNPFDVHDVVEITRRIKQQTPFVVSSFQAESTMTKIVDMLLRERGQSCYSVLIEPHQLTQEQQDQLKAFGYSEDAIPSFLDDKLAAAFRGSTSVGEASFPSFRAKVRLFSDDELSQYIVNLVGSEISGGVNFLPLRRLPAEQFKHEVDALKTLDFVPLFSRVVSLNVPELLLEVMYLFRPSELQTAFRFPSERISVSREKLYRTYHAPITNLPEDGLPIGTSEHPSHTGLVEVRIRPADRKRHMYVVGKTGTGKSMMLLGMAAHDLKVGNGVCVIDPHGDLIDALLPLVPEERKDELYVFDPSDKEYVMGFNFLEKTSEDEAEKDYLVQEIISILLRTVDYNVEMYGPRAQQWTRYACMTLMNLPSGSSLGGTLLEVPRLFSDDSFRRAVLSEISDEILKQYWRDEFDHMTDFHKSEMMGYFTSKFTPLITGPQIRNIVGQRVSAFNLQSIMNSKKILLVNLASGKIGRRNSELLGSMLVSRILWTAMTRAWQPQEERTDFYLYVDEFQNFITDSFEIILSEARKYGLNLVVAHQHLAQLTAMGRLGDKIERAAFGNVGTVVVFRTGPDAIQLAIELGEPAEASTLRNLENRYAVIKLLVNDVPTLPFTMRTLDQMSPSEDAIERGVQNREYARRRGRPLSEVDSQIRQRYHLPP